MSEKRRATSIEEFLEIQARLFSPPSDAEAAEAPAFPVRPTDVFITPYAKSGTTWLQQIFHTLRTNGDMDFEDISAVVPWLEVSPMVGIDVLAAQRAEPRGFKSHAKYEDLPAGARYIVSVRHPADVAYSLFKFMEGWFIEPGTITADEFVCGTFLKEGAYFDHLLSWWPRRNQPDVLMFAYEHMKQDLDGTIRAVAEFCGIALSDELMELTRHHASLEFMQQHKDRFDDALLRVRTEETVLPPGSDSAKVRSGNVGERSYLSEEVLAEIAQQWRDRIEPELGYKDYQALLDVL